MKNIEEFVDNAEKVYDVCISTEEKRKNYENDYDFRTVRENIIQVIRNHRPTAWTDTNLKDAAKIIAEIGGHNLTEWEMSMISHTNGELIKLLMRNDVWTPST